MGRNYLCRLMPRIMAIDYGSVRTGIAVTDPLQIIASGLDTVPSAKLMDFLRSYTKIEAVDCFVVGEPKRLDNTPAQSAEGADRLVAELQRNFPHIAVERMDERFTSKMALQAMISGGLNRTQRADKALVDKVSATLILQSYLEWTANRKSRA